MKCAIIVTVEFSRQGIDTYINKKGLHDKINSVCNLSRQFILTHILTQWGHGNILEIKLDVIDG